MEPRPFQFADYLEVIMSPIEALKAEAAALRMSEEALGRSMKHCDALERVARRHGYENWRACSASLASGAPAGTSSPIEKSGQEAVELKRYTSSEWSFALDVPERWNRFPAVSSNSPYEVVRFASSEGGNHLLIVFRWPNDPRQSLRFHGDRTQQYLAEKGYANFAFSETAIGPRPALLMEFDKPQEGGVLSCRHYFVAAGTLGYTLGFGTTLKESMFGLYDRVAMTFEVLALPS
jgi:hypothetical protein